MKGEWIDDYDDFKKVEEIEGRLKHSEDPEEEIVRFKPQSIIKDSPFNY